MNNPIKTELVFDELNCRKSFDCENEKDPLVPYFKGARYQHSIDKAAHDKIVGELKSVLDLNSDEYVKQVGTWKIIQRLEEQVSTLTRQNAKLREQRNHWIEAVGGDPQLIVDADKEVSEVK